MATAEVGVLHHDELSILRSGVFVPEGPGPQSGAVVGRAHAARRRLFLAKECVQTRQTCSVGISPTRVRVRSPVARVASVEETKRMKPTDKAIFGMVSESPGRNASEPSGGLDRK